MKELIPNLMAAVDYIEENITEELDIKQISSQAGLSPFYFQKVFRSVCHMSVGEYIRKRRMTLAAEDLIHSDERVIDIGIKYCYDSPDSFRRAFNLFHGLLPIEVRKKRTVPKSLCPLKITEKGTITMNYRIEEKASFTIVGRKRRFSSETSYVEVPKFWDEHFERGYDKEIEGRFGACVDCDEGSFDYLIADLYMPWNRIPEGCETVIIEASLWAIFPYSGSMPDALQQVNTKIWSEWLPSCKEYNMSQNCNLEVYFTETEGEIWVPIKKI